MDTQAEEKTATVATDLVDLTGAEVLVTGASGGIGSAIVKQLAGIGARPWVHYKNQEAAARDLVDEVGVAPRRVVQADVAREDDVDRLFGEIEAAAQLDALVVNAGIWEASQTSVRDMSFEQWRRTLAVNLDSAFLCCRAFLRTIGAERERSPSIVLIGSTSGVFGEEGHADYSASKSAMRGLMLTIKNEIVRLHERGRVNLVNPGWVATPMAEAALEDRAVVDRVTSTMALRKVATPEDVASSVLYLLSEKLSGHVSGQAITVAGGMEGRLLHS